MTVSCSVYIVKKKREHAGEGPGNTGDAISDCEEKVNNVVRTACMRCKISPDMTTVYVMGLLA